METAIVSLICIALIVFGGMTMSQGFLTSADSTTIGVEEISVREREIMRTELDAAGTTGLSWANSLRVTLENMEPKASGVYIQLRVDDNSLAEADRTRVET